MNKENLFLKIINETLSDNSYLGDDCAFLSDLNLIVSQDTLIQDVHFKTEYFTPYEIGKKAVLVNVSDILAGGGVPKYITVSLSGALNEKFVKDFYSGINEICNLYNIKVIGGDLTKGDKISVSICIFGDVKNRKVSSRKNAKAGYSVFLQGVHGSSATGLKLLLEGNLDKNNEFIKAHLVPVLYPEVANSVAFNCCKDYCMMDTSDGLYDALNKVSKASGTGFEIDFDKITKKTDDKNLVLFGGEDFGLLICVDPLDSHILDGLNVPKIGVVTDTDKIIIDGIEIKEDKSFNHF